MIPIKLTLRNFMSYGEEPTVVDFSGMHVVCLSGDNGNGKSALLDAMTYALWGETRASGSQGATDDYLIRLNADEMDVAFEFGLGHDRYRALRKRSRRTNSGDWSLLLYGPDGTWRPVGGTGIRETQKSLQSLLRMKYETFLNSAYLQQGRADTFTRQKPQDRKRILGEILELSRYDRLEEMARERMREADRGLQDITGEIRILDARAGESEEHKRLLSAFETEASRLADEVALLTSSVQVLRDRLAAMDTKQRSLVEREKTILGARADVAAADKELAGLRARVVAADRLIGRRAEIERDIADLQRLRGEMANLQGQVKRLHDLRIEQHRLHREVQRQEDALKRDCALAETEWKHVVQRDESIRRYEGELETVDGRIAGYRDLSVSREHAAGDVATFTQEFAELRQRNERLKLDIVEVEEAIAVLSLDRAACPTCGTDLSGGKRDRVVESQRGKRDALAAELEKVKHSGADRKRDLDRATKRLAELDEQSKQLAGLQSRRAEIAGALEREREANADKPRIQARLEEVRRILATSLYAEAERASLAAIEPVIATLAVAEAESARVQTALEKLTAAGAVERHTQLLAAEQARVVALDDAGRVEERLQARSAAITEESAMAADLRSELAGHEGVRTELASADRAQKAATESHVKARTNVEGERRAIEDCADARKQAADKKLVAQALRKDKQAYSVLAGAFGKKGIQTLIIENALPEIQDEANRLLSRMTDNAMQVQLSTLRDAKSGGGQIETLDIKIHDDAGMRPYEMYSGGEAFRVNFALRIALSRLLARRSGAQLQTLILDEGFGTQDAKGRERLVEAIESVRDEFALILVISHVEALKDAFPTRIEVVKTPSGSQINYLE